MSLLFLTLLLHHMHIKKPKEFLIKLQMEPICSSFLPSPLLLPLITSTHLWLLFHFLDHYFLAFPTLTPYYRFDASHFMLFKLSLFNITLPIFQCIVSSTSITCLRHMPPYAHNPTVDNCSAGPVLPSGYVKHSLSAHLCLSDSASTPAVWVMSKAALDLGYKSDECNDDFSFPATSTEAASLILGRARVLPLHGI